MTNTEYLQLSMQYQKSKDYISTRKNITPGECLQEFGNIFLLIKTLREDAIKYDNN
jgi:hypothetical protein